MSRSGSAAHEPRPDRGRPASAGAPDRPAAEIEAGGTETIHVVEETARIDKRAVETARVRVQTRTGTTEEVLRETLRSDAIEVTRVPIDRVIAECEVAPTARTENGVTIIPVPEKVLVVEKRLVLKGEVHIRQTTSGEAVEVPVTLRRQHAVIERVSADGHVMQVPQQEKTP